MLTYTTLDASQHTQHPGSAPLPTPAAQQPVPTAFRKSSNAADFGANAKQAQAIHGVASHGTSAVKVQSPKQAATAPGKDAKPAATKEDSKGATGTRQDAGVLAADAKQQRDERGSQQQKECKVCRGHASNLSGISGMQASSRYLDAPATSCCGICLVKAFVQAADPSQDAFSSFFVQVFWILQ